MRGRRVVASLIASVLLAAAASPAYARGVLAPAMSPGDAPVPKLNRGIFDCYTRDRLTGLYIYTSSVHLKAMGAYDYALNRTRKKLVLPVAGTYKMGRGKLTFIDGPLQELYGKIQPADAGHLDPYVALYTVKTKKAAAISCYQVRDF